MSYGCAIPTPSLALPHAGMRFRWTVTKRDRAGAVVSRETGEDTAESASKLKLALATKYRVEPDWVDVEYIKPPKRETGREEVETERFIADCVAQLRALPVDARPIMRALFVVFDVFASGSKTYAPYHWCDKATRDDHLQHAIKHEVRANRVAANGELPVDGDGIAERAHELARRIMAFWMERRAANRAQHASDDKTQVTNG